MLRSLVLAAAAAGARALVEYDFDVNFGHHASVQSPRESSCPKPEGCRCAADALPSFMAPDGVDRMVPMLNGALGAFGPEVRIPSGDSVSISVRNDLTNTGLAVHWHGITRNGWYDGVAFGTQCPIGQKETLEYKFTAHQHGTYFYHAHTMSMRNPSLAGPLILEDADEPFVYDEERIVMLSDWWNVKDDRALVEGLRQQKFRWVGDPQSILINGAGCAAGDWTACPAPRGPAVIEVEAGKTYRLRIINTAAMSFLSFGIQGHTLTVVEIDGHYVTPFTVDTVELNVGNRYSVLFTANQPVGNYWQHASTRFRDLRTGSAVLRYAGASSALPTTAVPVQNGPVAAAYSDASYIAAAGVLVARSNLVTAEQATEVEIDPCPTVSDRLFVITNSQERMTQGGLQSYTPYTFAEGGAAAWLGNTNVDQTYAEKYGWYGSRTVDGKSSADGWLKWPVHVSVDSDDLPLPTGTAADSPGTPIALGLYYGVDHGYPAMYNVELGNVVTIIVQNARALNGKLEQHPWHLHGHDFWTLGMGMGTWNESLHKTLNTQNPPKGDVVTVYPGAWAAIRYVADVPGAFAFHCHISWHIAMGNAIYFATSPELIMAPPKDHAVCGAVTTSVVNDYLKDDEAWAKKGNPSKDCPWVKRYLKRCEVKGVDGTLASEGCARTCA